VFTARYGLGLLTTTFTLHKAVNLKQKASTHSLTNQDRTTTTIPCLTLQ
jgi:hypothetical protein